MSLDGFIAALTMTLSGSMIGCSTAKPNEPELRLTSGAGSNREVLDESLKTIVAANTAVMGSANTSQQYMKAGLFDEIQIHLVPVLLGENIRLFDHLGTGQIELQRIGVI